MTRLLLLLLFRRCKQRRLLPSLVSAPAPYRLGLRLRSQLPLVAVIGLLLLLLLLGLLLLELLLVGRLQ